MTYSSTQTIGIPPVGIHRPAAVGTGRLSRLLDWIGFAIGAIGCHYARRRDLRVLSQLDDRLLLDIGLGRFEIEQLCRGGR